MKMKLINNINIFINGIDEGPFKDLKNTKKSDEIASNQDDLFKKAVNQGYLDMKRTTTKEKFTEDTKEAVFDYAYKRLKKYFESNNNSEFDRWHKQTIKQMKKTSGNYLTVGQCQKIINMSFKYLYCCKDYGEDEDKKGLFVDCHMPLDSYTLEWYKHKINKSYKGEKWSKIDDYDDYLKIINDIREYIKKNDSEMTVLEKEFIVWNTIKKDKTIKEFEKSIKTMKGLKIPKKEIRDIFEDNLKV